MNKNRILTVLILLGLLVSCATTPTEAPVERAQQGVIEEKDETFRQAVSVVSLPELPKEESPAVEIEDEPSEEVVEIVEVPEAEEVVEEIVETAGEDVFEEAVPVVIVPEAVEAVPETVEEEKAPSDVVSVNLAGEDMLPASFGTAAVQMAPLEPVEILPDPEPEPEPEDEIKPEDLIPYDVTVTPKEPWYSGVLAFLSTYGVWIAILSAIFAIMVILIVIVSKKPEKVEHEMPKLEDEGLMEDETTSQATAFDPDIERQLSVSRMEDASDDDEDFEVLIGAAREDHKEEDGQ